MSASSREEVEEEFEEEEEDEEEEGSEFEGSTEEEEEEDDERLLKYEVWRNTALRNQTITSIYVTDRAIVVGTSLGELLALDSEGCGQLNTGHKLRSHENAVKDICVDANCDYIASVCEGGVLFIQNLTSADFFEQRFDRPLLTITLHPRYKHQEDKPFVCGGNEGRVLLSSKGFFFGNRKLTVLDDKCGRVFCTRWNGNFICWATEREIVVCNAQTKAKFFRLARLASAPRPELFKCNMFWESETRLIVAWGNFVRIIKVTPPSLSTFDTHGKAEVEYGFETDRGGYRICGLVPFDYDNYLIMLTTSSKDGWVSTLEVRIVSRMNGQERVCEELSVKSKRTNAPVPITQYILAQTDTGNRSQAVNFIITPTMGNMLARRTDNDDKVKFLLQQEKYVKAYEFAKVNPLKEVTIEAIGEYMLNDFFKHKRFVELANCISEVLAVSQKPGERWEFWIEVFYNANQVHLILDKVPYHQPGFENVIIKPSCYETLLYPSLKYDVSTFRKYMERFRGLYDIRTICVAASDQLKRLKVERSQGKQVRDEDISQLGECVGLLFEFQKDYGQALRVFLDIRGSHELFDFITRHQLFDDAATILDQLFEKSAERTLQLLTMPSVSDIEGPLCPENVVKELEGRRALLWLYVQRLARGGASHLTKKFEMVIQKAPYLVTTLYIDFDPDGLLQFLRRHYTNLNLRKTYEVCRERQCIEASVYVMAKMGEFETGLNMLIHELKNVPKAIAFILEHCPNEEEQDELFKKLVDLVFAADRELKGSGDAKYFEYFVRDNETWESIARRHGIPVQNLCSANSVGGEKAAMKYPSIRIPINMLEALLTSIADPKHNTSNIDPIYLIRQIPRNYKIPNLAGSLNRISTNKKHHATLMKTIISMLQGDISDAHSHHFCKLRQCVRIDPMFRLCDFCRESIVCSTGAVTFRCGHVYHNKCALRVLRDRGAVRSGATAHPDPTAEAELFFSDPSVLPPGRSYRKYPFCVKCPQVEEDYEF